MEAFKTLNYGFESLFQVRYNFRNSDPKRTLKQVGNQVQEGDVALKGRKGKAAALMTLLVPPLTSASSNFLYVLHPYADHVAVYRRETLVKRYAISGTEWNERRHWILLENLRLIAVATGTGVLSLFDYQLQLVSSVKLGSAALTLAYSKERSEILVAVMGCVILWPIIVKPAAKHKTGGGAELDLQPRLKIKSFQLGEWVSVIEVIVGKDCFYAAVDSQVRAYRLSSGESVSDSYGLDTNFCTPIASMAYDPGAKYLAVGSTNGVIHVYNNQRLKLYQFSYRGLGGPAVTQSSSDGEMQFSSALSLAILFDRDLSSKNVGKLIALYESGLVSLFDLTSGKLLQNWQTPDECKSPLSIFLYENRSFGIAFADAGPVVLEWHQHCKEVDHVHIQISNLRPVDETLVAFSPAGFYQIFEQSAMSIDSASLLMPPKHDVTCNSYVYDQFSSRLHALTNRSTILSWQTSTNPGKLLTEFAARDSECTLSTILGVKPTGRSDYLILGGTLEGGIVSVTLDGGQSVAVCKPLGRVANSSIKELYLLKQQESVDLQIYVLAETGERSFRVVKLSLEPEAAKATDSCNASGKGSLKATVDSLLTAFELPATVGPVVAGSIHAGNGKLLFSTQTKQIVVLHFDFGASGCDCRFVVAAAKEEELHASQVTCSYYNDSLRLLVTGAKDRVVKVWEVCDTDIVLLSEIQVADCPTAVAIATRGSCFVALGQQMLQFLASDILSKRKISQLGLEHFPALELPVTGKEFDSSVDIWPIYGSSDENSSSNNRLYVVETFKESSAQGSAQSDELEKFDLEPFSKGDHSRFLTGAQTVNLRAPANPRVIQLHALCLGSPTSSLQDLATPSSASRQLGTPKNQPKSTASETLLIQSRRLLRMIHTQLFWLMGKYRSGAAPNVDKVTSGSEPCISIEVTESSLADDLRLVESIVHAVNNLEDVENNFLYSESQPHGVNKREVERGSASAFLSSLISVLKTVLTSCEKLSGIPLELRAQLHSLIRQRDALNDKRVTEVSNAVRSLLGARKLRKPVANLNLLEPIRLDREMRRRMAKVRGVSNASLLEKKVSNLVLSLEQTDLMQSSADVEQRSGYHKSSALKAKADCTKMTSVKAASANVEGGAATGKISSKPSTEQFKSFLKERRQIKIDNQVKQKLDLRDHAPLGVCKTGKAAQSMGSRTLSIARMSEGETKESASSSHRRQSINLVSDSQPLAPSANEKAIIALLQDSDSETSSENSEPHDSEILKKSTKSENFGKLDGISGTEASILQVTKPIAATPRPSVSVSVKVPKVQVRRVEPENKLELESEGLPQVQKAEETPVRRKSSVARGVNVKLSSLRKPSISQNAPENSTLEGDGALKCIRRVYALGEEPEEPEEPEELRQPALPAQPEKGYLVAKLPTVITDTVEITDPSQGNIRLAKDSVLKLDSQLARNGSPASVKSSENSQHLKEQDAKECRENRPERRSVKPEKSTVPRKLNEKIGQVASGGDTQDIKRDRPIEDPANLGKSVAQKTRLLEKEALLSKSGSSSRVSEAVEEPKTQKRSRVIGETGAIDAGRVQPPTADVCETPIQKSTPAEDSFGTPSCAVDAEELLSTQRVNGGESLQRANRESTDYRYPKSARSADSVSNECELETLGETPCDQSFEFSEHAAVDDAYGKNLISNDNVNSEICDASDRKDDEPLENELVEDDIKLDQRYVELVEYLNFVQSCESYRMDPTCIVDFENFPSHFSSQLSQLLELATQSVANEADRKLDDLAEEDLTGDDQYCIRDAEESRAKDLATREGGKFLVTQNRCLAMETLLQLIALGRELLDIENLVRIVEPQLDFFLDDAWEIRAAALEILPRYSEFLLEAFSEQEEDLKGGADGLEFEATGTVSSRSGSEKFTSVVDLEIELGVYKLMTDSNFQVRRVATIMASKYYLITSQQLLKKRLLELGFLVGLSKQEAAADRSSSFEFYKSAVDISETKCFGKRQRNAQAVSAWLESARCPDSFSESNLTVPSS